MDTHHPSRRHVLRGLAACPSLAVVLADPGLARAAAAALQEVSIPVGGGTARAALALPEAKTAPAVLLIHEWWGLNDQMRAVTAELAKEGFVALAVDLYGGRVAATPEEAETLRKGVDPATATETLVSWVHWLRQRPEVAGGVATCGWCFGGGWSLETSIATPVEATIIYYGRVDQPGERLAKLRGPVLGHFATRDSFIDKKMVQGFEALMALAGKPLTVYWYEADHAFANPTGGRYDAADAALAWERSLAFLRAHT